MLQIQLCPEGKCYSRSPDKQVKALLLSWAKFLYNSGGCGKRGVGGQTGTAFPSDNTGTGYWRDSCVLSPVYNFKSRNYAIGTKQPLLRELLQTESPFRMTFKAVQRGRLFPRKSVESDMREFQFSHFHRSQLDPPGHCPLRGAVSRIRHSQ